MMIKVQISPWTEAKFIPMMYLASRWGKKNSFSKGRCAIQDSFLKIRMKRRRSRPSFTVPIASCARLTPRIPKRADNCPQMLLIQPIMLWWSSTRRKTLLDWYRSEGISTLRSKDLCMHKARPRRNRALRTRLNLTQQVGLRALTPLLTRRQLLLQRRRPNLVKSF